MPRVSGEACFFVQSTLVFNSPTTILLIQFVLDRFVSIDIECMVFQVGVIAVK